ncbi:hypothetical protein BH09VER1_BH09VER1_54130 [soil metagenome]
MSPARDLRLATVSLFAMGLLGVALLFLFPGSAEQDAPYHFVEAQRAWAEPIHFVKVWARPFYTTLFSGPALLGLAGARFLALAIGLVIAWQTWKLAHDLALPRAWLATPLLLAQPNFLQLYPDLLTEPSFALLFVLALRLHLHGWIKCGMLVASLLPLARPEGFFLGVLWGLWILGEAWQDRSLAGAIRAIPSTLLLASGSVFWWLAALVITGDPLFILHDWPQQWHQGTYGFGSIFSYAARAWEFAGPLLIVPLLVGLALKFREARWFPIVSPVVLLFLLHSIFRVFSLFGEAGYPRYMVSVSPALAVLTLAGWNALAVPITHFTGRAASWIGASALAASLVLSVLYSDSLIWSRDIVAIREMHHWLKAHPQPINRFIWSNAYMAAVAEPGFPYGDALSSERAKNLQTLRDAPSGTLVFWDDKLGPDWFGLSAQDIESCGYQLLRTKNYLLPGAFTHGSIAGWALTRNIEVSLLYKP